MHEAQLRWDRLVFMCRREEIKDRLTRHTNFNLGLDLQANGLTAGLTGHCQPDKRYQKIPKDTYKTLPFFHNLWKKGSDLYVCFKRNNSTFSALMLSKQKAPVSPMSILSVLVKLGNYSANFLLKQHISKQGHRKGHVFHSGHHASHICRVGQFCMSES